MLRIQLLTQLSALLKMRGGDDTLYASALSELQRMQGQKDCSITSGPCLRRLGLSRTISYKLKVLGDIPTQQNALVYKHIQAYDAREFVWKQFVFELNAHQFWAWCI